MDAVSYTYPDGALAVRDIDLDVREGRIVGICGPSGCGKSTLLSMLAAINAPTCGTLRWFGDGASTRHRVSMVFQTDTLLPWRTVRGNASLHADLNGVRGPAKDELLDELLELTGLSDASGRYPYQLSGGMRRRLAFVTAMAAQPRLLLLDEPFSALDEPTRIAIHQDVLTILRRLGTTVVLVTHDLAEAASLCDEIVILTAGPGTVATRHRVPFGPARSILELRADQAFLALYGALWRDLSAQITVGRN